MREALLPIALVLLVPVVLSASDRPTAPPVPQQLLSTTDSGKDFLWVSAEKATLDGELDWSALGTYADTLRDDIRRQLREETGRRVAEHEYVYTSDLPSGCFDAAKVTALAGPVSPDLSLKDAMNYRRVIVVGRVSAATPGFVGGRPETLLTVSGAAWIEAYGLDPRPADFQGVVYVPFPKARFSIGWSRFCTDSPRYAYMPKVGDTVVVVDSGFFATSHRLLASSVIFTFPANQDRVVPPAAVHDPGALSAVRTPDDLVEVCLASLETAPTPE